MTDPRTEGALGSGIELTHFELAGVELAEDKKPASRMDGGRDGGRQGKSKRAGKIQSSRAGRASGLVRAAAPKKALQRTGKKHQTPALQVQRMGWCVAFCHLFSAIEKSRKPRMPRKPGEPKRPNGESDKPIAWIHYGPPFEQWRMKIDIPRCFYSRFEQCRFQFIAAFVFIKIV